MRERDHGDRHSDLGPSSKDWQPGVVGRDEDFTPAKDLWKRAHSGPGSGQPDGDVQGGGSESEGPGEDMPSRGPSGRNRRRSDRSENAHDSELLDEELEDSFPASDPPTVTQPGATGWEPGEADRPSPPRP